MKNETLRKDLIKTTDTVIKRKLYQPYVFMLIVFGVFLITAFILDTPSGIISGLYRIITSRSVLLSDYIAIGGFSATLVNAVLVGLFTLSYLLISGIRPNGSTIMGMFLSVGFAFFGKNIFNVLPITLGVWLFAKVKKLPFRDLSLSAMLSATLSPIVSELAFSQSAGGPLGIILGIAFGIAVGFIFPPVSAALVNAHGGFCLYNMGFSGGLIAAIFVSIIKSIGYEIESVLYWSSESVVLPAILLYGLAVGMIVYGIFSQGEPSGKWEKLKKIHRHSGRLVTDFYVLHGNSAYINMGALCILATTLVLVLGGPLNGPVIGAVLTVAGFGAFGKHLRNTAPLLAGAIICVYLNKWDPVEPVNLLAILFSTCAAPIAGHFGWTWGIVAGFLHVAVSNFISLINGGLNLYNNGFASGLVVMVLVPLIMTFRRERDINGI